MHPLNDSLPGPCVPVRVTRVALVAHRYTYAPPRRTFVRLLVSLWNDLADPVFEGVGLAGFKSWANAFLLAKAALSLLLSSTIFSFLFFLSLDWHCGAEVFGLIGCISLSLSLFCRPLLIKLIKLIINYYTNIKVILQGPSQ